jgi:hypothetical protein
MNFDFNSITRKFLLNEALDKPTTKAYIESVVKILENIRPKSQKESRQIAMAHQHLKEIKKNNRKLEERVSLLEEQVKILEENKLEKNKNSKKTGKRDVDPYERPMEAGLAEKKGK